MRAQPWYRRKSTIIGLLILVPPLGIGLMARFAPWSRRHRWIAAAASTLWLLVVIGNIGVWLDTRRQAAPSASPTPSPASPTRTDAAPIAVTPIPASLNAPIDGKSLVWHYPRLLLPAPIDGFRPRSNELHLACCGVTGKYLGVGDVGQHLVAEVWARNEPKDELPIPSKTHTAVTLDSRPAVISEERTKEANRFALEFKIGGWYFAVTMFYERPQDRKAARAAVERIAGLVAANADRYLAAGSPPADVEQKAQLAALEKADEEADQHDQSEELAAAPRQFVAALEKAGVGSELIISVVRNQLDREELIITVASAWHYAVKQERLQAAQNLWKLWASVNSPQDPDNSRIRLVDRNGNEVGGSRLGAGSLIKVKN